MKNMINNIKEEISSAEVNIKISDFNKYDDLYYKDNIEN